MRRWRIGWGREREERREDEERERERGRESKTRGQQEREMLHRKSKQARKMQLKPPSPFSSLTNWEICESSNIPAAQAMMVCTNVSFLSTATTTLSRWAGYWGIISRCVEGRE